MLCSREEALLIESGSLSPESDNWKQSDKSAPKMTLINKGAVAPVAAPFLRFMFGNVFDDHFQKNKHVKSGNGNADFGQKPQGAHPLTGTFIVSSKSMVVLAQKNALGMPGPS